MLLQMLTYRTVSKIYNIILFTTVISCSLWSSKFKKCKYREQRIEGVGEGDMNEGDQI